MENDPTVLALALGAAAATGGLFALGLATPFRRVALRICDTGEGAAFWTRYLVAMLVLAPLTGVAFVLMSTDGRVDLGQTIENAAFFIFFALLTALTLVGFRMAGFVREDMARKFGPLPTPLTDEAGND